MPEDQTPDEQQDTTTATPETEPKHEDSVSYERFKKANEQAREAKRKVGDLEKAILDLQAKMQDRENADLPELERERKRAEALEKRIREAEERAAAAERDVSRSQRERWVTAAAGELRFADPSDAAAFLDLDSIEDERDAQRAVKRLAGAKKHLLRSDDPVLPGRVLRDGQRDDGRRNGAPPGIDREGEANMLAGKLGELLKDRWQTAG